MIKKITSNVHYFFGVLMLYIVCLKNVHSYEDVSIPYAERQHLSLGF